MKNSVNSKYEEMFYQALRIRRVEEKIIDIYPTDKIQSPVHLSIGQEAVAVGVCSQLKENDLVFINYRGHAFYLAKGGPMPELMAIAEEVTKVRAVCTVCAAPASRSQRLYDASGTVLVGGSDKYEARCRACFQPNDVAPAAALPDR